VILGDGESCVGVASRRCLTCSGLGHEKLVVS